LLVTYRTPSHKIIKICQPFFEFPVERYDQTRKGKTWHPLWT